MFLHDEQCIRGLMVIMGIALRLLTLAEFVVRQHLEANRESLPGLYEGNPHRQTNRPTTERMLKAFEDIMLIGERSGRERHCQVSELSKLQKKMAHVGLEVKCPKPGAS